MNWGAFIYAIILTMIVLGIATLLKIDLTTSIVVLILFNHYYDKVDNKED